MIAVAWQLNDATAGWAWSGGYEDEILPELMRRSLTQLALGNTVLEYRFFWVPDYMIAGWEEGDNIPRMLEEPSIELSRWMRDDVAGEIIVQERALLLGQEMSAYTLTQLIDMVNHRLPGCSITVDPPLYQMRGLGRVSPTFLLVTTRNGYRWVLDVISGTIV